MTQVAKIHPPGSAVLLQYGQGEGFALLQKIDPTPGSVFHGKYSLFGGRSKPGENPQQVLERELREEWRDQSLVTEILGMALAMPPLDLPAREWHGMYRLHLYVASASDRHTMLRWMTILQADKHAVKEGQALYISQRELRQELEHPGRFLAGIDIALYRHLALIERSQS